MMAYLVPWFLASVITYLSTEFYGRGENVARKCSVEDLGVKASSFWNCGFWLQGVGLYGSSCFSLRVGGLECMVSEQSICFLISQLSSLRTHC